VSLILLSFQADNRERKRGVFLTMDGDGQAAVTVLSASSTTQMNWNALIFMDKKMLLAVARPWLQDFYA